MSTATTVSRTPSAWRLGMVSIWPAVLSCLGGIAAQYALNALFAIVFGASSDRGPESGQSGSLQRSLEPVGIVPRRCRGQPDDLVHARRVAERSTAPHPGARELRLLRRVHCHGQHHLVGAHPGPAVPVFHAENGLHPPASTPGCSSWSFGSPAPPQVASARTCSGVVVGDGESPSRRSWANLVHRRRPIRLAAADPHSQGRSHRSHAPVPLAVGNHSPRRRDRELAR